MHLHMAFLPERAHSSLFLVDDLRTRLDFAMEPIERPEPKPIEIQVDHRCGEERQHLADDKSPDDCATTTRLAISFLRPPSRYL